METEHRVERWTDHVEILLMVASLVFLVAYAWPIVNPRISHDWHEVCDAVTWAVWAAFGVDYVVRLALSSDRLKFLRGNVFDLIVLILPLARPLRLLRVVGLLSVVHRLGAPTLRGRVISYAVGGAVMLLIVSSLAITEAERGRPGSTIGSVGDGLWWAITTMTTVGYGDRVPVTIEGRCIAAGLMLGGVALLGVLTGTFASWLVAEVESTSDNQDETRATVRALADEVRALRNEVTALRDDLGVRGASHTGPATGRDP